MSAWSRLMQALSGPAAAEQVAPQTAAAEAASGKVVLLDVREPSEWGQSIAGAVRVPLGQLQAAADPASRGHKSQLDPARRTIVYCQTGRRSARAVRELQKMGYEDVANLKGGIVAWKRAGLPVKTKKRK